jgi:hypothetical protein
MEIIMLVNIKMENLMGLESIHGQTEVSMKGSSKMGWNMEMVFGERIKMIWIQIDMKESTNPIKSMAMVNLLGLLVTYIKATITKMNEMAMEKCIL